MLCFPSVCHCIKTPLVFPNIALLVHKIEISKARSQRIGSTRLKKPDSNKIIANIMRFHFLSMSDSTYRNISQHRTSLDTKLYVCYFKTLEYWTCCVIIKQCVHRIRITAMSFMKMTSNTRNQIINNRYIHKNLIKNQVLLFCFSL